MSRSVASAVLIGLALALASPSAAARPAARMKAKVHRVYPGQHLGMIAKRYNVSVDAIRAANDLDPGVTIKPGQKLYIPPRDDPDGSRTQEMLAGTASADGTRSDGGEGDGDAAPSRDRRGNKGKDRNSRAKSDDDGWRRWAKPAGHRGYLELVAREDSWKGYVVVKGGKVLPAARRAFSRLLATSDGQTIDIDPRLIKLMTKLSDAFGGRPIHVVSGYRLESYARRSRHRTGQACDLTIPGVPNSAIRDYLKTAPQVGIGYYPNSHFVHLDVREQWTYWVDYSGPGEPPRYAGFWTRPPTER